MKNPMTIPMISFSAAAIAFFGLLIITLIVITYYISTLQSLPSPENLALLVKNATTNANIYPKHMPDRKSLNDYLQTIGQLSADNLATCNFYVMTANLGGFFSPINQAAFCPEAVQYAIQAGARGLIFDVWPDINNGTVLNPILQVCESDTSYKKLSYYTLDLPTALNTVRKEAFENSANPANNDPMFLFFRFRGSPTVDTLNGTANAISAALEQYRLPYTFTSTTNNPLYSTPIQELSRKVIILSNQTGVLNGQRTRFAEYVNNPIQPSNPLFAISTPVQVQSLAEDPLVTVQSSLAQQNILTCAPLLEDIPNSESNAWNWNGAQDAGIQLCGLNFWVMDEGLKAYMDPTVFGTYSFKIKPIMSSDGSSTAEEGFKNPVKLRYTIERIPPPMPVKNLGYGDGTVVVK